MTIRATFLQLRDRLKAATGPSRELDTDLACALAGFERHPTIWCSVRKVGEVGWSETLWDVPAYTASIDAAVTLVPSGLDCEVINFLRYDGTWHVEWYSPGEPAEDAICSPDGIKFLPIALCLARIEYELARSPAQLNEARDAALREVGNG